MAPEPQVQEAQPSLQGIPPELVASDAKHTILVRRLQQAVATAAPNISRDGLLLSATTLHPLSQTCRMLHIEFQQVHLATRNAGYAFVVNNFDMAQMQCTADLLRTHFARTSSLPYPPPSAEPNAFYEEAQSYNVFYDPSVELHFQLNENMARSAQDFLDYVKRNRELPSSLVSTISSSNAIICINSFAPTSKIHFNDLNEDMTPLQALKATTPELRDQTRWIFSELEALLRTPDYMILKPWAACPSSVVYWIREVWGQPLSRYTFEWRTEHFARRLERNAHAWKPEFLKTTIWGPTRRSATG